MAAAFGLGLVLATFPARTWSLPTPALLIGGAAVAVALAFFALRQRRERSATVALLVAVVTIAMLRGATPPLPPDHIARLGLDAPVRIEGRLVEEPARWTADRTRLLIEAEAVGHGPARRSVSGLVQLTVYGPLPALGQRQRVSVEGRVHRPVGFRNPGGFDYPAYLARRGIFLVGSVRSDRVTPLGPDVPPWPVRVKRAAVATINAHLPAPSAVLLAGLILGERAALPTEVEDAFRRAGVLHVLAVSGFNVALVAGAAFFLLSTLGLRRRLSGVGAGGALIAFALVVGPEPSVLRASLMGLTVLGAVVLERESQALNALALAALLLLAWRPADLWDPGFQLSFAASTGIVWLARPSPDLLPEGRLARALAASLAVSLAAQLSVAPIMAAQFNHFSLVGAVANLAVVPLAGLATVIGLAGLALAPTSDTAGDVVLHAVWPLLVGLRAVVRAAAAVPAASVALPSPGLAATVCWYAALAVLPLSRGSRRWRARAAALAGCAIGLSVWPWVRPADDLLKITVLDVGQGDATLIELPDGPRLLVDGGPAGPRRFDVGRHVVSPFLWNRPATALDVVALSHSDPDHSGGLAAILTGFRVGEFWENGQWSRGSEPTRAALERSGTTRHVIGAGERRSIGSALVTVIHPERGWAATSENDQSLVLRLDWRGISLLLPGDLGARGEAAVLARAPPGRVTILKVAHHGSRFSSTPDFLQALRPTVAVISVGARNPFRHPAPETLERLAAVGARIYRTDRDGAVGVETDGKTLWVTRWATGNRERVDLDPGAISDEAQLDPSAAELP